MMIWRNKQTHTIYLRSEKLNVSQAILVHWIKFWIVCSQERWLIYYSFIHSFALHHANYLIFIEGKNMKSILLCVINRKLKCSSISWTKASKNPRFVHTHKTFRFLHVSKQKEELNSLFWRFQPVIAASSWEHLLLKTHLNKILDLRDNVHVSDVCAFQCFKNGSIKS